MDIKSKLANSDNYTKGRSSTIKYIVIHFTANNGDTAKGNCNYFQGTNRNASAHYFVDENEIYQSVKDSDTAWHCGAKKYYHLYCRNNNSIGVELCSRINSKGKYYFKDETVNNAVWLVKQLMKKYNVPIDKIVRHYDVTHKNCPAPFVDNINEWNKFKTKLSTNDTILNNNLNNIKEDNEMVTQTSININGKNYTINRILKDGKNYIQLSDLKQAGFDVGYNEKSKIPSFGVSTNKINVKINNKNKELTTIMKQDENYIRLRDLQDILNIDYKNGTVIINNK